jgi:adenine/guanine phosphoribosyltransferase-like PRPP-binding protein
MEVKPSALGLGGGFAADGEWPFRVQVVSQELEAQISDPEFLLQVADELLAIAEKFGCQAVSGASTMGAQLAGALAARSSNGLRLFTPADSAENVLVVDGVLATGAQVVRAVNVTRHSGARRAIAAVLIADKEALEACRETIGDEVVALTELSLTS